MCQAPEDGLNLPMEKHISEMGETGKDRQTDVQSKVRYLKGFMHVEKDATRKTSRPRPCGETCETAYVLLHKPDRGQI